MATDINFWDGLNTEEAGFVQRIMSELAEEPWAQQLIATINGNGGIVVNNKAFFFELRFGYALHQAGIIPQYEIPGEGTSTIDFGFTWGEQTWAVELMRLEETDAVQAATIATVDQDGVQWSERLLSTDANDSRQSPEGETLKAVERICQKCEKNGQPYKFPTLNDTYHVILVDFRTFAFGGDDRDRIHVALGGEHVPPECRHYWDNQLISGVFHADTPLKGARYARERVHLIGFVNETAYDAGAFGSSIRFIANPNLFITEEGIEPGQVAVDVWPIR